MFGLVFVKVVDDPRGSFELGGFTVAQAVVDDVEEHLLVEVRAAVDDE